MYELFHDPYSAEPPPPATFAPTSAASPSSRFIINMAITIKLTITINIFSCACISSYLSIHHMCSMKMLYFCICFSDSHLSQPLTQAARQSQTSSCLRRKLGKTLLESLDLIQKSTSAAIYSFTYLTLIISWQNKLAHKRFSPSIYSWSKDDF